jgi:hypothetical protein
MALNDNKGIQLTEADKKYQEALKEWKKQKPTRSSMFNNRMGALGSEERANNQAKLDKALDDWKAKEPKKSDFKQTEAVNTTPNPNSKTTETVQVRSDASSVRTPIESSGSSYPNRPRGAERGKTNVGENINQFFKNLKPSKGRLSPSQRMRKAGKTRGQILRKRLGK